MASVPPVGALRELKRLLPYLRRYRGKVAWGMVFVTISNICSTTIPRMVGQTIDVIRTTRVGVDDVTILILQILALTIGSGFFMFATRRTIIVTSRLIEEDIRNDFIASVRTQSQEFFQERSTGSLIAHFTNDVGAVREFIGPAVMYTANTITTFAFALSWMFLLNATLTAAIVIPVPFIAWATYSLGKRIHQSYKRVQEEYELITTHAQETFSGVRVVRAYAREDHESDRFNDFSRSYYRKNMHLARFQSLMMPSMTVLFNISYIVVIGVGGWQVMQQALTVGQLTQFFIYLNQLLWPIAAIGWVTGMIQRGAASIGRLGAIIDAVPTIRDTERTQQAITSLQGSIEFEHVSVRYGDTTVLNDVSVSVPAGTSLGIVGLVGSGKSSFIDLIPRLSEVTDGVVRIDGHDVRTVPLSTLRGAIAMVPQESFLFSDTIRNNVRFARATATDDEVHAAADVAQLTGDIASLVNGFETVVGERGITLSGGQKQRTALARAILADPRILILDDALSAVDTDTEERILRGLRGVMRGRTTILISHRISTVKDCDQIIVLHHGAVAERGDHASLLALQGFYATMYERQLLEEELS
ncbi:MAG: ABC transporter ATP-binding protein [Bacteroidetes bacterium]|nr:ABC transporter ATP-binding protein [Bacteroidota bacterium]